jgi:hypothetical protein
LADLLPSASVQQWSAPQLDGQQHINGPNRSNGDAGGLGGLGLQALAMAVGQLQRCGLAEELLPTLMFAPLDVDGVPTGRLRRSIRLWQGQTTHKRHICLSCCACSAVHMAPLL